MKMLKMWMVVGLWLGVLILSLSACQMMGGQRLDPARIELLNVIEMPNEIGTEQVAVTAKGYVYVKNWSGTIAVLEKAELIKLLPPPQDRQKDPWVGQMAVHPQTDRVYVTDQLNHVVRVLDGLEFAETITDIGFNPYALAIHPHTGYVYVGSNREMPNTTGATISVITNTQVITEIPIGLYPKTIVPEETSDRIYVGQLMMSDAVFPLEKQALLAELEGTSIITTTSLEYAGNNGSINDIAINPNTGEIYMIENLATLVYWHGDTVKRLNLGGMGYTGLHDIAIDPKRNLVYVSSWGDPRSHVVVLKQDEVVDALVVGNDPRQIIVDETRDAVYVVNRLSGTVSFIRDREVLATLKTRGNGPMHAGLDEARGYLYVSNSDSHSISVFGLDGSAAESAAVTTRQHSSLTQ